MLEGFGLVSSACRCAKHLCTVCPTSQLKGQPVDEANIVHPCSALRPLRAQRLAVAAMFGGDDDDMQEGLEQGSKVRVKESITVYHAPKLGELDLQGKEGTILEVSRGSAETCMARCTPGDNYEMAKLEQPSRPAQAVSWKGKVYTPEHLTVGSNSPW